MLHSKNIEDVLHQGLTPVRTTSKSLLAISLITPTGAPLSSCIKPSESDVITKTKLKMFALLAINAYVSAQAESNETGVEEDVNEQGGEEEDDVFSIDVEDYVLYLKGIKGTKFSVLLVSEKGYPLGVIRLKMNNLSDAFEELSKFEYVEED